MIQRFRDFVSIAERMSGSEMVPAVEVLSPKDAGELLTLQRSAFVEEALLYGKFLPPLLETLADVRRVLSQRDVTVLGVRDGGRLIASVRIMPDGEIARLAVVPDRQGQGLGTKLLQAADRFAPAGVDALWLYTGDRSEKNLRFYERHGFEEFRRVLRGQYSLVYLRRPLIVTPRH
jgi:GNAT superfamily N-acetyltransferase